MARLVAALSGGVDSSVAAAIALDEGHEVTGITLKQWSFDDEETRLSKGCCTLDAVADARRVCDVLGIAHYTLDLREDFAREVVDPFVEDYAEGRTPNPCIRCNERVRFGLFLERALRLGFDGVVTGHYARIERDVSATRLFRARNTDKDQSYVLYRLGQNTLQRIHFPLGTIASKDEVRDRARALGLPNADRQDSVEVCFVGEGRRPGDVVAERRPEAVHAGPIVDRDGHRVGEHRGLAHYTVGQRRGLGSLGGRRYVTSIRPDSNTLVVDEAASLDADGLEAIEPCWVVARAPEDGTVLDAVVRYHGDPRPANVTSTPRGFVLDFASPVRAVAPGQAVVLYRGDEVVGGGTITRAR